MRKVIFLIALVALVSAAVAEGPLFSRNRQREMSVKVDSVMCVRMLPASTAVCSDCRILRSVSMP